MSDLSKSDRSIVGLVLVVPITMFSAYVLTCLWAWFVVPLGVVAIGKAHAFGLSTMISLLRAKPVDNERDALEGLLTGLAYALIAWGLGALAHWLM
jgi:hypothetical protein